MARMKKVVVDRASMTVKAQGGFKLETWRRLLMVTMLYSQSTTILTQD